MRLPTSHPSIRPALSPELAIRVVALATTNENHHDRFRRRDHIGRPIARVANQTCVGRQPSEVERRSELRRGGPRRHQSWARKGSCMADEHEAEDVLTRNWSQYTRAHKTQCVGMTSRGGSAELCGIDLLSRYHEGCGRADGGASCDQDFSEDADEESLI